MEKRLKICGVTGHRKIPTERVEHVKEELSKKIRAACADGYTYFISGFADGADLIFAEIVCDIKREHDGISLEAALPYPKTRYSEKVQALLSQCDSINYASERYHPGCFMVRNQYITDKAALVIAVYDGRLKGGTYKTIQFARNRKIEVQIIEL